MVPISRVSSQFTGPPLQLGRSIATTGNVTVYLKVCQRPTLWQPLASVSWQEFGSNPRLAACAFDNNGELELVCGVEVRILPHFPLHLFALFFMVKQDGAIAKMLAFHFPL